MRIPERRASVTIEIVLIHVNATRIASEAIVAAMDTYEASQMARIEDEFQPPVPVDCIVILLTAVTPSERVTEV